MIEQNALSALRADIAANHGYPKSIGVLTLFRLCQALRQRGSRRLYPLAAAVYKMSCEWVLGIEIPPRTAIGPGLRLRHGVGLVINPHSRIGANVLLRQGVTLGNRHTATDCPVIEDDVQIGAGACVVGPVTIGAGSRIGPGCVVVTDVPPQSSVYLSGTVIRPRRTEGAQDAETESAETPDIRRG